MDIEKMIQETIQETVQVAVDNVIKELKELHVPGKHMTAFQQVETLLYNYPKFQDVIKSKLEEIDYIRKEGIAKRSKSFVQYSSNGSIDLSNDYEKAEAAIEKLQDNIREIESYLSIIDSVLQSVKKDPYFKIIQLKYFEGKTNEKIAQHLRCDVATVTKNRKRLIYQFQIRLFPDEVLAEMGFIA